MTEWLNTLVGEAIAPYAAVAVGLFIILILIALFFRVLRSFRGGAFGGRGMSRLGIIEAAALEDKRRLVLIRRDNVEHLILIGGQTDLVIEQGISRSATAQKAPTTKGKTSAKQSEPASNQAAPKPATSSLSSTQTTAQTPTTTQASTVKTATPLVQNPSVQPKNTESPANDSAKKDQEINRLLDQIAGD